MTTPAFNPPRLVRPDGQPQDGRCPRCHAVQEKRVPSSGFGQAHDVCGVCGWEFEEFTCQS